MSEEQTKNQPLPEEVEDSKKHWLLILQIAREAVSRSNIPNLSLEEIPSKSSRWNLYYQEVEADIILSIQLELLATKAILHTSLGFIASSILRELETLLSSEKAMKLLSFEESDREQIIYDKVLRLTQDYIHHLPLVIFHSFHQALKETIVSHIKKFVEYDLREDWEEMGLPKDFTIIPDNNLMSISKLFPDKEFYLLQVLEAINEEFSAYRKGAFSNRKVWFNEKAFAQLPNHYEKLKLLYQEAKKQYKQLHEAFFKVNRRATIDDWEKYWEEFYNEKFPEIFQANEIKNFSASQLTCRHLADVYGFNVDYMEKLVRNAKAQQKDKLQQKKQKPDK